jgi:L-aspartate oxidase
MYDLLVIGAGVAGLASALKASASGAKVLLLTKGPRPDGSTNYAQGGIASVTEPGDTFASHVADTLEAGVGLCKKDQVAILARNGPATIRQLVEWGVRFTPAHSLAAAVPYDLHLEGGHSHHRILHAADLTGKEIMRALLSELKQRSQGIDFLDNSFALDLLTQERDGKKHCVGALVVDQRTGNTQAVYARATLLATGGAGKLWLHSTNPADATGDGMAMAWRAGAVLQDLEFMQFHPTSLYAPQLKKTFLISEAVRGFGGIIKNHQGEEFMDAVHPLRSLAPRDIVARAIHREMERTGQEYMYLDVTHRSAKDIKAQFPNIYAKCLECGIDMTKDWIPVVPAAHFMCGGVLVDTHSRSSLPGLYACGEVAATGVHGANRLASNSLLESVVFALRACADLQAHPLPAPNTRVKIHGPDLTTKGAAAWNRRKLEVQEIMWLHCGIVRSLASLAEGLKRLQALEAICQQALAAPGPCSLAVYEFRNIVQSAQLVIQNALKRKESRGLQCLTDYPEKNDKYLKHFSIKKK